MLLLLKLAALKMMLSLQASEAEYTLKRCNFWCFDFVHSTIGSFASAVFFVFLQDASKHDSAPSPTPAPDKGIKGVKFSEAAIILDTESELNDSDDDGVPQ